MFCVSRYPASRPRSLAIQLALLPAIALFTIPSQSQISPAAAPPTPQTFEVASIRMVSPHSADDLVKGIGAFSVCTYPTNRFFVHYAPLRIIISMAFDDNSGHVSGPDWLDSQLYSIDANVDGDKQLSREEMKPLLQSLLQQRFHLVAHHETKMASGFALIVAKGSPKLHASKEGTESHFYILPNGIDMRHAGMATLAGALASQGAAGGPVIDKTGIQGEYDITLHYATVAHPDPNLPDIFTALQEQLGLKLVPQKVPVDFLVIDHADKIPTEN
jgi:uncharacterized protein (TIGR03435 family)